MVKKLKCWLGHHQWGEWACLYPGFLVEVPVGLYQRRECKECHKKETSKRGLL